MDIAMNLKMDPMDMDRVMGGCLACTGWIWGGSYGGQ